MMECSNCIYSKDCGTTIRCGLPCLYSKELESAIITEIEKNYGEITPKGKNIITKVAEGIAFRELTLIDGETEKNADKMKKYGNSYGISQRSFMYDEFAEAVIMAQKALTPTTKIEF